ncbi:hypothetical protein [uncultured Desulfobacter sp.]|uniref:hypothetical protein n=1 Tax=uncultured Desulfobacter sp. TaxID=240139 RepID=UPI00259BCC83|nr:hypothetical protein [uncultured Desulfobacter sp.]
MSEERLKKIIEGRIPGLLYIILIFVLVELGILVACLYLGSDQEMVTIYSPEKKIIYEGSYNQIRTTEFKNLYGIKDYKQEGYEIIRKTINKQFPTRTWIGLSICVPLVPIFFIVFLIRTFEDVFDTKKSKEEDDTKEKKQPDENKNKIFEETRFEKLFSSLGRLNIYSLGAIVMLAAFFFWMVPDLLIGVGRISVQTILQLKWIILAIVVVGGIILILRTIFAYKTRKEIIQQQTEIQKYRDQLAMHSSLEIKLLEGRTVLDPPDQLPGPPPE